eukprot:scaffold300373_cov15-Tisochrysis_lutea.AAC.1
MGRKNAWPSSCSNKDTHTHRYADFCQETGQVVLADRAAMLLVQALANAHTHHLAALGLHRGSKLRTD